MRGFPELESCKEITAGQEQKVQRQYRHISRIAFHKVQAPKEITRDRRSFGWYEYGEPGGWYYAKDEVRI